MSPSTMHSLLYWSSAIPILCIVWSWDPNHFPNCVKANHWEGGRGGNGHPQWLPSNTRHPVSTQWQPERNFNQPARKKKAPSVTSQAWEAASEASIPIAPSNMDMCIEARWQSHNPNSCSHLFHKWINLSGPNRFDQDQTTLLKLFRHFQAGYKLGTRTTFFRNTHFIDCLFSC